jgi:hypothetical protein
MKPQYFRQIFEKSSNTKFHENPSSASRVVPCGRTDGHDDARSRFSLRTRLKTREQKGHFGRPTSKLSQHDDWRTGHDSRLLVANTKGQPSSVMFVCRYVDVHLGSTGRRPATFTFTSESLRVAFMTVSRMELSGSRVCRLVLLF